MVGGSFVRWGYRLSPKVSGTVLIETWEFLPDGIAKFEDKYGDEANDEIAERTQQALNGTPTTPAEIKQIAESIATLENAQSSPARQRS